MALHVRGSIIHSGQDIETTEASLSRCRDKEDVVSMFSGILLSHKKRGSSAICDDMDGAWNIMLSKTNRKNLFDFTHMWNINLKATSEQKPTKQTNA